MMIYVVADNQRVEFPVEESWSIYELKRQIRSRLRIPLHQQQLSFLKPKLKWCFKVTYKLVPLDDDEKTLSFYKIRPHFHVILQKTNVPMRVNVLDREGVTFYCDFEDEPLPKIGHLKDKISQKTGLPIQQIMLFFKGKELGGDLVSCPHLFNQGIEHNSSVSLRRLKTQIPIELMAFNGDCVTVSFWPTETITDLQKVVEKKLYIPVKNQKLMFNDNRLRIGSLNYNGLEANSTVNVYRLSESDSVQLYVKLMDGRTVMIEIELSAIVEELKARIVDRTGIPIDQQRLIFASKQLEDGQTLHDYGMKDGSKVHLLLRLRGC